jgi:flagellar hook-associated protein 1 FlgK
VIVKNIVDFAFGSQQNNVPATPHAPFRTTGLGPDLSVATGLPAEATLENYARNLIARQSEAHSNATSELEFQTGYRETLEKRLLDDSGVDLDQEVAKLQELQAAYAASAKMIATVQKLFDDLLAAIR